MLKSEWTKKIEHCDLFLGVEPEQIDRVLHCLKAKIGKYRKGEIISHMTGEYYRGIGLLLEGDLAITVENAAGGRAVIGTMHEGDIFGEAVAFTGNTDELPVITEVSKSSVVLFMDAGQLMTGCANLCNSHLALMKNALRIMADRTLILKNRIYYMSIKSLRAKISSYIWAQEHKGIVELPLNRNNLAEYLNVSRPALSRELGRLRDEKIIDFKKNVITILDRKALLEMTV